MADQQWVRLTEVLEFGGKIGSAPIGTLMRVQGAYGEECFRALWDGKSVIVPKQSTEEVVEG